MKTKLNKNLILGLGAAILMQACGGGEPQAQLNYRHRERMSDFFAQVLLQAVENGRSLDGNTRAVDSEFVCDKGALDFKGKIESQSWSGSTSEKTMDIELNSQPKACFLQTKDAAEITFLDSSLKLSTGVTYSEENILDPETGDPILDPILETPLTQIVGVVNHASLVGSVQIEGEGNIVPGVCRIELKFERRYDGSGDEVAQTVSGGICGESVSWEF